LADLHLPLDLRQPSLAHVNLTLPFPPKEIHKLSAVLFQKSPRAQKTKSVKQTCMHRSKRTKQTKEEG